MIDKNVVEAELKKEQSEIEFRAKIASRNTFGKYPNKAKGLFVWFGKDILFYDKKGDAFYLATECKNCGKLAFTRDVRIESLDQIEDHRDELDFRHACPSS